MIFITKIQRGFYSSSLSAIESTSQELYYIFRPYTLLSPSVCIHIDSRRTKYEYRTNHVSDTDLSIINLIITDSLSIIAPYLYIT